MKTRVCRREGLFVLTLAVLSLSLSPGASAEGSPPDAATIAAFRNRLNRILTTESHVATVLGKERIHQDLSQGVARLQGLADDDAARLIEAGVDLSPLDQAVKDLDRAVTPGASGAESMISPSSPGLPDAPYSLLCGSVRPDTNVASAAQLALQAVAVVWAVANRACEQVTVAGGAGGNASLACVGIDLGLEALQFIATDLSFCARDIDSAEIKGTYERAGHIHADLEIVDGKVDASRDAILADSAAKANALVANDNANRDAILARLGACPGGGGIDALNAHEIEDNLAHDLCPAWMYTPEFLDAAGSVSLGGRLGQVLDVLRDVIDDADKLGAVPGHDRTEARQALDDAVRLAARRPLPAKRLCDALLDAYEEATAGPRCAKGHHHKD